jgi:hypothetical protein
VTATLIPISEQAEEQHTHRWAALVVLCAAALVINVDNTILNVALPTLVRDLSASSSELQWIVDSYAMVFAGLLLVGGSLADRFGRKRFFLIGPIAGGLLLARFWWGSIFLVNVPIIIAAFVGALVLVPSSKNPTADRPDPTGAVLSIAGLGLLLWAIIEAPSEGWGSSKVVAAGVASLVVLGSFVAWEAHCRHPMLKLTFFAERRFSVALAAESLGTFGLLGALFLQTQFLQFDLGNSPLQAGLRILPMALMLVLAALLSPIIARSIGEKLTVAAGLAAVAGGLWQISAVATVATTYGDVVAGLLLLGLGAGLLLPTATNSVVRSVPQGDSGMGSATNAVALQVGGALGVAVIGSVMATRYQHRMSAALAGRHVPMDATHTILGSFGGALAVADSVRDATGALLSHAARGAFMSGLEISFAVGAVVALGGVAIVLAWLPSRNSQQSPDLNAGKSG